MAKPSHEQLKSKLVGIIADGFNRSMNALERARAIDRTKLREHYRGVGTKYYDLVTEQLEYTAEYGAQAIATLYSQDDKPDLR